LGPLLAPVRDLVVLDPYNPVGWRFRCLRSTITSPAADLEEGGLIGGASSCGGLGRRADDGRGGGTRCQIAFALEQDLLNLADAIDRIIFRMGPSQPAGKADGASRDLRHPSRSPPTAMKIPVSSRAARYGWKPVTVAGNN